MPLSYLSLIPSETPSVVSQASKRKSHINQKFYDVAKKNLGTHLAITQTKSSKSIGVALEQDQSKETNKIASIRNVLFSYLIKPPFDTATTLSLKAASRTAFTFGSPSEKENHRIKKIVDDLTGSSHLVQAMRAASPFLAEIIQKKLTSLNWADGITKFLSESNSTILDVVKVMLPKVYVNLAKNYKERIGDQENNSFTVVEALACLTVVFNTHISNIRTKIEFIDKIEDVPKREKKLCQLFAPLSAELLTLMLPEGEKELPFLNLPFITKYFFSRFKNHVLPAILLDFYRQMAASQVSDDKHVLSNRAGGNYLITLVEESFKNACDVIPTFCLEISRNTQKPAKHTPFTLIIANRIGRVFSGSETLRTYLTNWLTEQIESLCKSQNSDIKLFWKFLGSFGEPLLMHILRHISEIPNLNSDDSPPGVTSVIAIKCCAVLSTFFNANMAAIENRLQECKKVEKDCETDGELIKIFRELTAKILLLIGLEGPERLPIPDFIKDIVIAEIKELAPTFLLRQYLVITEFSLENITCEKKIRTLFFDPKSLQDPSVATSVLSSLYHKASLSSEKMHEVFYQELWEKSGTELIVQTVEAIISVCSSEFVESIFNRLGISKQTLLNTDSNPFMKKMRIFLGSMTEMILLNIIIHLTENSREDHNLKSHEHPHLLLGLQTVLLVCGIINKGTRHIQEKLQEIQIEQADSTRRLQEIRKVFLPLVNELILLVGKNPLDHLPLDGIPGSDVIKDMIWQGIKNTILPDILYASYLDLLSWHYQSDQSSEDLEKCYRTTHPAWASRVLAQYISDFLRHYLITSSDEIAAAAASILQTYFVGKKDAKGAFLNKILHDKSELVRVVLSRNIHAIGASKDPQILQIWPILTKYIEAIVVKIFSRISLSIKDIEAKHPDFMIDAAIHILKTTSEYFNILNEETEKSGVDHVYSINPAFLIVGLGSNLHDGVPLDPSASEAEKKLARLQGWVRPLICKLLKLTNLSPDHFPIPSLIRKPVARYVIEVILPNAMHGVNKMILDPSTRDAIVLYSVELIYTALNAIDPIQKNAMPEIAGIAVDSRRKRLNESCGAVVLEMVKLIPDTMVQYVFMKEKMKNLSAEVIGDAIMAYLSKWTLLHLIDTLIYDVLPVLYPSRWEGKSGRESLIPRKAVLRSDGKMALQAVKKFKFTFPESPQEISEDSEYRAQKAVEIRDALRDAFTRTISSQVFAKAWTFIKALWKTFQEELDKFILLHFPDSLVYFKGVLDCIFHIVFFDFLGPIAQFLGYPFIQLIKYIVEKTQIDKKSDDIIENIHFDTVEHLIYKWVDSVIDTLVKLNNDENNIIKARDGCKNDTFASISQKAMQGGLL